MDEQAKEKTGTQADGVLRLKAKAGFRCPCFYQRKLIWITDKDVTELVESKISYLARIEIDRALKSGHLIKE